MNTIPSLYQKTVDYLHHADGLPLLALRLYLAPVFWIAGTNKLAYFEDIVMWFEHGLALPLSWLMAALATWTEIIGAVILVASLGIRLISAPLSITMLVAIFTLHWPHWWQSIADPGSFAPNEHAAEAAKRLNGFLGWLKSNHPGLYHHITEFGKPVILNNGIEFAATYLVMLLVLFFQGAGRYVSVDYFMGRKLLKK